MSGLFRWAGGKGRIVDALMSHIDMHRNCDLRFAPPCVGSHKASHWIEPFVGGGAVALEAMRRSLASRYVLADGSADVMSVYKTLAQDDQALFTELRRFVALPEAEQREQFLRLKPEQDRMFPCLRALRLFILQACGFNGIGSTGYVALKNNRRYVGSELKQSYYESAIRNLDSAIAERGAMSLFDLIEQDAVAMNRSNADRFSIKNPVGTCVASMNGTASCSTNGSTKFNGKSTGSHFSRYRQQAHSMSGALRIPASSRITASGLHAISESRNRKCVQSLARNRAARMFRARVTRLSQTYCGLVAMPCA
jgi:hypothetical protein